MFLQLPSPQTYNAFDWILLALLAWCTVVAFLRGIVRVLFSFAGLIGGILLAGWYYHALAPTLSRWIASVPAAEIAAFLLIAAGTMVVFGVLGGLLSRTARVIGLGLVDRLLGALFGFARGCLLGVAVMMAIAAFLPGSAWIAESRLAPYFLDGAHAVSFVVPNDLRTKIVRGAEELKHNAPDWIKPRSTRHNGASMSPLPLPEGKARTTIRRELDSLVLQMHSSGISYAAAVRQFKRRYLLEVLANHKGNQCRAAEELGIHRNTLSRILAELDLDTAQIRSGLRRPVASARPVVAKFPNLRSSNKTA